MERVGVELGTGWVLCNVASQSKVTNECVVMAQNNPLMLQNIMSCATTHTDDHRLVRTVYLHELSHDSWDCE